MKSTKYIKLLCMLLLPTVFISCNKDDEYFDEKYQSTPITVTQVYLDLPYPTDLLPMHVSDN